MAYFNFVHRSVVPMFHSIFTWKKKALIFLELFASENVSFLLLLCQLWHIFFINMDTSAKFTCWKTLLVITFSLSVKPLNTKCWNPMLFVLYREHIREIRRKNEYRKENRPISDGFPRILKTENSFKTTSVSYMHLCSQSFGLGVGQFTKSQNYTFQFQRKRILKMGFFIPMFQLVTQELGQFLTLGASYGQSPPEDAT